MKRFTSETLVAVMVFGLTGAVAWGQQIVADCGACGARPLCAVRETIGGLFGVGTAEVPVLCSLNLRPAAVLSRLDIDQDGVPDNSPDTDGDGLPDNWEAGGVEALSADGTLNDRAVFFAAPTAIVPGTPPTPIFTRLAVATSALDPDTDDDGLSDFVEVFGLKFIDENDDGILQSSGSVAQGREWVEDGTCGNLPAGADVTQADLDAERAAAEPGDGLPSPGECPRDNSGFANGFGIVDPANDQPAAFLLRHDFDGYVFTDPVNSDTDGDSINDKDDNDPLINPRSFGVTGGIIIKFNVEGIDDFDQDGLGNGMDMGNDLLAGDFDSGSGGARDFQEIDNPENIFDLIALFRRDLIFARDANNAEVPIANPTVPEAAIEDLLGADWDGNGLWRTTDVRTWHMVLADGLASRTPCYPLAADDPATANVNESTRSADVTCPPEALFALGEREDAENVETRTYLFSRQSFGVLEAAFEGNAGYALRGVGLGWQDLLQPTGGPTNFLPDPRVWAILYSWRVPGFDIDGDGFVGVPNLSNTFQSDDLFSVALDDSASVAGAMPDLRNDVCVNPATTDNPDACPMVTAVQFDDFITIPAQRGGTAVDDDLDGRITVDDSVSDFLCGVAGLVWMPGLLLGLGVMRTRRIGAFLRR